MSGLAHYKYIDALRGFAFLGVLTVHASLQVPSLSGATFASAGAYGVQLFFLLSAVTLLRSVSLRTGKERFPLRNFFLRRFFRIAPLFWFGIVLSLFLDGTGGREWAPHGVGVWHLLSTATFLHGWTPVTINSVVPGGWSIAVEMTFYLCLPFLARRVTSIWSALSLAFYCVLAASALNRLSFALVTRLVPPDEQSLVGPFVSFWFPAQLPVFLVGFLTYHCLHSEAVTRFLAVPRRAALLAIIAVYGLLGLSQVTSGIIPLRMLYAGAFSALILALAARPFTVAVNPATCHLGVLSFSCYITHFAVLKATAHFIRGDAFASLPAQVGPWCHFAAVWVAALVLTVAVSTLTYFFIEKPGIKLGNLLIRRHEGQASVTRQPASA